MLVHTAILQGVENYALCFYAENYFRIDRFHTKCPNLEVNLE